MAIISVGPSCELAAAFLKTRSLMNFYDADFVEDDVDDDDDYNDLDDDDDDDDDDDNVKQ